MEDAGKDEMAANTAGAERDSETMETEKHGI